MKCSGKLRKFGKFGSKTGVTLVELLVVILIVTILSVSLLPLLKPFIVDAQYAAEPIPVLGNVRTMIGLYYYNKNHLPGLPLDSNGLLVSDVCEVTANSGTYLAQGTTQIHGDASEAFRTQTWFMRQTAGEVTTYEPSAVPEITDDGGAPSVVATADPAAVGGIDLDHPSSHFGNQIDINYQDLTGKRLRPHHFAYRVESGAYNSGAYVYAVGVFGDNMGLPSGTGYAVIEIVNPSVEGKFVGTWKRNKPVSGEAGQIRFASTADAGGRLALDWKQQNVCWIGNASDAGYLSTDSADVATAITALREAGWEF